MGDGMGELLELARWTSSEEAIRVVDGSSIRVVGGSSIHERYGAIDHDSSYLPCGVFQHCGLFLVEVIGIVKDHSSYVMLPKTDLRE